MKLRRGLTRPYCSATAKAEIRRAINMIHREDNYDGGMELLCKLAGVKTKRVSTKIATMADLEASSQNEAGKETI